MEEIRESRWQEPEPDSEQIIPLSEQEKGKTAKSRSGSPLRNQDIKVINHLEGLDIFKKKSTVTENDIKAVRNIFVKYCINLYNEKVAPMVTLLNRRTSKSTFSSPTRTNIEETDTLEDRRKTWKNSSGLQSMFANTVKFERGKNKKVDRLKLNNMHESQIINKTKTDDSMIMEEIKYYEAVDHQRMEDDEQREIREEKVKKDAVKLKLMESAPLRYKMKIKYVKIINHHLT